LHELGELSQCFKCDYPGVIVITLQRSKKFDFNTAGCIVHTDPGKSWKINQMAAAFLTQCTHIFPLYALP